jgi:hypothetical protein
MRKYLDFLTRQACSTSRSLRRHRPAGYKYRCVNPDEALVAANC